MWYIYNNIKIISHTTNNIAVAGTKYNMESLPLLLGRWSMLLEFAFVDCSLASLIIVH